MFSKYGMGVLLSCLTALIVAALISWFFIDSEIWRYSVFVVLAVVAGFVLNFFRDPRRTPPQESGVVVSPADGTVISTQEMFEGEYLKQDGIRVSIFMSPLNVHVNRIPISGIVRYFRYIQGEYIVAFDDKSSERNERTHIGIENDDYKVFFKQIAGAVARRIVAEVEVGQKVTLGERFGMIKFGSRVDVIVPNGSELRVKLNEKVKAGETVLATYAPRTTGPRKS